MVKMPVILVPFFTLCRICELVTNSTCVAALEYVGPVPYDILKPVLECCTPAQLYNVEDFNPVSFTDCNISRLLFGRHFVNTLLITKRGDETFYPAEVLLFCFNLLFELRVN